MTIQDSFVHTGQFQPTRKHNQPETGLSEPWIYHPTSIKTPITITIKNVIFAQNMVYM